MSLRPRYIDFDITPDITLEWQSTMAGPHRSAKHFWKTLVLEKAVVEVLTRSRNSMLGISALTEFRIADIRRTREKKKKRKIKNQNKINRFPLFLPPQAMNGHEHRRFQFMPTNYSVLSQRHTTA